MSIRRRIVIILSVAAIGLSVAGFGALVVYLGLETADQLGSVVGAFMGTAGLVVAAVGLSQAQRSQREIAGVRGEQLLGLAQAAQTASAIPVRVRHGLPADLADFVDREEELARIEIRTRHTRPGPPTICTISGMAGVGKTALAVRAAHRIAGAHPDGRYFLNLHAYSSDRPPVTVERALEALLGALGIPARQIPETLEERASLWRSETSDSRILLLLDNAADADQVLALLPSGPSAVIVTSRRRMAVDGGCTIMLGTFDDRDAIRLLTRSVDRERVAGAANELQDIASRCGHLPLALRLVARQFVLHPTWSVRDLLAELTADRSGREMVLMGHEVLMSAFDLSYESLDQEQRRFLRRLVLHPDHDFGVHAAAALDGATVVDVTERLDALVGQNLLEEPMYRRYQLHDLVREYARHRASEDAPGEVAAARNRLIDYYTVMTIRVDRIINLLGFRDMEGAVDMSPAVLPSFSDHAEAVAWLENERPTVHACVELAVNTGEVARAARLARAMAYFLRLKGYWTDAAELCHRAARWCDELGDHACGADMRFLEGDIARLTCDHEKALTLYRQALNIYRELNDAHHEARALHSIGDLERMQLRYDAAIGIYEQALASYRDAGNRLAEARAKHSIADAHRLAGRGPEAMDHYQAILPVYRELGDAVGEARVLHGIADVQVMSGLGARTLEDLQGILLTYRELGDRLGEADALYSLGAVYVETGQEPEALSHLENCLDVYRTLGDKRKEADTERALGDLSLALGRREEGVRHLRRAFALLEDVSSPLAAEVRSQIDQAEGPS
ncbi:tetratricopeptide repeat protein [Actinocorallia sp. B10E7]|uniref:ATP-binding protein n=1 Tax=Actinocorallia sp. B10E7 TaxID=3153558 RepID=UPI00325EB788